MILLLHKPLKAVGTFKASLWYEQFCCLSNKFAKWLNPDVLSLNNH